MSQSANEELARRAWRGVAEGDVEALKATWDAKIVWNATGLHPWAGRYEGMDAVLNHIAEIGESCDQFDAQLDDFLTNDHRIVYFFRAHIRRGSHAADIDYAMFTRHTNGLMTEVWLAPLDAELLATLWK